MREFIDIVKRANTGRAKLTEAPQDDEFDPIVGTRTRSRDAFATNFADPVGQGQVATRGRQGRNVSGRSATMPAGQTVGRGRTRSASSKPMPAQAGSYLASLMSNPDLQDEISDEEARRNAGFDDTPHVVPTPRLPPTPDNLPAVISRAVTRTDGGDAEVAPFDPEWHQVKHLPGYMQGAIRALGRQVFAPFTNTPIEDIQVLSTITNPTSDVQKMMAWIRRNGVRDDAAELNFDHIMPGQIQAGNLEDLGGYQAKVQLWNTEGYQFLLVHDFAGYYVYGWPGGRGVHVTSGAPRRRIGR